MSDVSGTGEVIVWRLHCASPPERVYEALTTDAGRSQFWAESTRREGDELWFTFIHGEVGPCPVVEETSPSRFALVYFGHDVSFTHEPDGSGGTDLELRTSGFTEEDRDDVLAGWLNVLFPLKGYVDFGIDLRNHDPERSWKQKYVDQ
ncbi:MAG: hypothetical protein AAGA81_25065 [Acidobacteriota bacterium]